MAEAVPWDDEARLVAENLETAASLARRCDRDVACWLSLLDPEEVDRLVQAMSMLTRYGDGEERVLEALVRLLAHPSIAVRGEAIRALDQLCPHGDASVVAAIDRLSRGATWRPDWRALEHSARVLQARLRHRADSASALD